ncbi:MBL fold metallo-hydrolase [uncultured Eubacterium sp.]|uniref:MBL fold metallo-hydrolase n=1 Tax=uncultured Eubacterium sp. TaxID=165185 RepID=UPI0025DE5E70|nr:MBL fold metallo-hydrolase [uncultured Eubacterium sp.]
MKVISEKFGSMDNNCSLIIDEKTNQSALVDCNEFSQKMIDMIGDTDLKYILLTHGHFDHIIGVKSVKEKYGAQVVISKEDEPMLNSAKLSLAVFCNAPQNNVDADIIVKDGDEITLGEIKIKVMATPGHTSGSVCYIAENCIFSGDTLFYCSCGRTDFPSGSPEQMMSSLQKLKALDGDYKVYTGHNNLTTLDFERKNNPYMK